MVAGLAILLLEVSVVIALLLGAILSSRDPVVLRDVVRDRRLPNSVRQALKIKAGINYVIVLPLLLILIAVGNHEVSSVALYRSRTRRSQCSPVRGWVARLEEAGLTLEGNSI
jgi:NhaP-type Na+/H+ or K+/H+ antiporter